ncbi:hypothetical protein SUGI_1169760 [Cryptomeria japonica]|nr:hypothetical protein SUGI_1169760 [Cryptomeria japonica]
MCGVDSNTNDGYGEYVPHFGTDFSMGFACASIASTELDTPVLQLEMYFNTPGDFKAIFESEFQDFIIEEAICSIDELVCEVFSFQD